MASDHDLMGDLLHRLEHPQRLRQILQLLPQVRQPDRLALHAAPRRGFQLPREHPQQGGLA